MPRRSAARNATTISGLSITQPGSDSPRRRSLPQWDTSASGMALPSSGACSDHALHSLGDALELAAELETERHAVLGMFLQPRAHLCHAGLANGLTRSFQLVCGAADLRH